MDELGATLDEVAREHRFSGVVRVDRGGTSWRSGCASRRALFEGRIVPLERVRQVTSPVSDVPYEDTGTGSGSGWR